MGVKGITVQSMNIIDLPQNGTMIYTVHHNEFIEFTLLMVVRGITVWSVNVIDIPKNGIITSKDIS